MALGAGTRLGPYEFVAPVGAGGMGEVYRAKDTRLDRTVAVRGPAERHAPPVRRRYDVDPDGERFLVIRRAVESDPDTVAIARNWTGMLKGK